VAARHRANGNVGRANGNVGRENGNVGRDAALDTAQRPRR
jgi:hypothetical protein